MYVFVKKKNKNPKTQSTLEDSTALEFGPIRIEDHDTCGPRYIIPNQFKYFKTKAQ